MSTESRGDALAFMIQVMKESFSSICSHFEQIKPKPNQEFLEAIGGLRFGLRCAADYISIRMNLLPLAPTVVPAADLDQFLTLTEKICTHHSINIKDHGPRVFLFKLLFRQYGVAVVHSSKTEQSSFQWLVPKDVPKVSITE